MSLIAPVIARVSQIFGANPNSIQPNGHTGKDYAIPLNTPIKAAGAGTVVWADWATKLSSSNQWWIAPAYAGICVVIDHGNGLLTLYAHLNSTPLNIGSKVTQGQQIGLSGSTGLSTGPHLHFEVLGWPLKPYNGFYGRLNPDLYISTINSSSSTVLKPNQRKVGPANVNMRAASSTTSKILRVIPANSIETFTGYFNGQAVNGNNLWYRDAEGFAHSAGFTTVSATGLPNTTPAPPKPVVVVNPAQRTVGTDNVNMRTQPNTTSPVVRVIAGKSNEIFTGYIIGESVKGINIWFKDAKGYAWAGGFTSQATTGLTNLMPKPVPVPTPAPKPPAVVTPPVVAPTPPPVVVIPQPAKYSFTKDFDFVEYFPADITNVQSQANNPGIKVFPDKPTHVVLHQFNAKDLHPELDGVIKHFQTERPGSESSAHFAVSGNRIVQAVSLKDRAYHAGKVGNDYIGIEVDPDEDAATLASVKKLLTAIKNKYGYLPIYIRHRDVPGNSTLCGADIHLELYSLDAPVTPPVTQPPVVVPPTVPTAASEREAVQKFVDWVVDEYFMKK